MSDNIDYNPKSPHISREICSICKQEFCLVNGKLYGSAYVSFTKDGQVDIITGTIPHTHQRKLPGFENV